MAQNIQKTKRPDPIPERVGKGMFTDRETEMASLMAWVEQVAEKYGRSRALVSHRRHGKTAILERLYNRLFWERDDVMPFYFELSEGIRKIWMQELAETYLYSFLQQYLAYRTRDARLAFRYQHSFGYLYKIAEKAGETFVMESIDSWLEDSGTSRALKIEAILHDMPHRFATETGLSIIVMFDEFQRLDQVLYYDEEMTRQCHNYTDSYSAVAESSQAPMLIAGSQVTILTQKALAGAMTGRVGTKYIKRLPLHGASQLVLKFARRRKLDISLALAYAIGRLVDGHPYYVWALFNSEYEESDLTTEKGVRKTLTFEVENSAGHINVFWQIHFIQNMEAFNRPYARKLMFYLSQYPDREVHLDKIIEDLALPIPVEEINETLRQLIKCDLIRKRGNNFYGGLSDPLLERVLRLEYSWEFQQLTRDETIEQIDAEFAEEIAAANAEIAKLRGELSSWVGRFAEMFIDRLMKLSFKGQVVDGSAYFNRAGEVSLIKLNRVFNTVTQPSGAPKPYQIDLYGIPQKRDELPWIVEVKNWQRPVNTTEVEHFWQAAQNLAEERGHDEFVTWFYSQSGFSGPAEEFLQDNGILYTDQAGLEQLLRDLEVVSVEADHGE